MPHAEKRDGKATDWFYGEVDLRHKGGGRFRRRFDTMAKAKGYGEPLRGTNGPLVREGSCGV